MLRITSSQSVAGAKEYFDASLRQADYYTEGQEIVGVWHGTLAARLHLDGSVSRTHFRQLLENRDPRDGEQLTQYTKEGRRPGYDFTFNANKGVSLLYAVTQDERIAEAHQDAVVAAMAAVEEDARTRVRVKGQNSDRVTGNIAWAEFMHTTARPVGGLPDPHLHTHAYVMNATWDEAEGKFKAVELGEVKADALYYEAIYHAHLARGMAALGYGVERRGRFWEVEGLPQGLLDQFSRRTAEIEAEAAKRGITSAEAKSELGARTRQSKEEQLTRSELRTAWIGHISPADRQALDRVIADAAAGGEAGEPVTARQAVEHAMQHEFANRSVVRKRELLTTAIRRGFGRVEPEAVGEAAREAKLIRGTVEGRTLVTTAEVLAEERAMIGFARDGRMACRPLGSAEFEPKDARLNADQRGAIAHVLTSRDRVMVVRGDAGVGKTSLLPDLVEGLREGGHEIRFFAPTHKATDELREKGFSDAETLAALLVNRERQAEVKGSVLVVDEAGMVSVPDMGRLMHIAETGECRVVLMGDTKQHASVARGDALRLLETHAGIRPVEVREIVRQKGAYKDAVATVAKGDVAEGMQKFEALGAVKELEGEARFTALAADYADAVKAKRSVLVVSPTHAEKDKVTAAIRAELLERGKLGKDNHEVLRLRDLRWSEAERRDPGRYAAGQVVKFRLQAPGIARASRFTIEGRDDAGRVRMRDKDGWSIFLPLDKADRFNVYREETLHLRKGDLIRLTEGGQTLAGKRLKADAAFTVKGFDAAGNPKIGPHGWVLSKEFGHVDHAYCSTSHASQGRTVHTVLVAMGQESAPAMSREQFYVTVSRGQETVKIYTDDKDAVRAAVSESGARGSATELVSDQLTRRGVPKEQRREAMAEATATGPAKPQASAEVSRRERLHRYAQAMARQMRQRAMEQLREVAVSEAGEPSPQISRAERQGLIRAASSPALEAQRERERVEHQRTQATLQAMDKATVKMAPRETVPPRQAVAPKVKTVEHQGKGVGHAPKLGA